MSIYYIMNNNNNHKSNPKNMLNQINGIENMIKQLKKSLQLNIEKFGNVYCDTNSNNEVCICSKCGSTGVSYNITYYTKRIK